MFQVASVQAPMDLVLAAASGAMAGGALAIAFTVCYHLDPVSGLYLFFGDLFQLLVG